MQGEWLIDLKEAIEQDPEVSRWGRYFFFDAKQNTKVDQPTRRKVARITKVFSPDGAEADAIAQLRTRLGQGLIGHITQSGWAEIVYDAGHDPGDDPPRDHLARHRLAGRGRRPPGARRLDGRV